MTAQATTRRYQTFTLRKMDHLINHPAIVADELATHDYGLLRDEIAATTDIPTLKMYLSEVMDLTSHLENAIW